MEEKYKQMISNKDQKLKQMKEAVKILEERLSEAMKRTTNAYNSMLSFVFKHSFSGVQNQA